MKVGDLVRHNGSGPVGWKMKGSLGVVIKQENWGSSTDWRVLWTTPVKEWYRDALWFRSELEVINENR